MNWAGMIITYLLTGVVGLLLGVYLSEPLRGWLDDE
jgi:hypothetical protein